MPLILLTNDDGVHAPGLHLLEAALADLGEVWTIAPQVEVSACGRAVTLNRPLRVEQIAERRLAVDGTTADCVLLGLRELLDRKPDLVVSGINNGYNIGEDLDYSGTVAGAAEGALQGVRVSLAVSVESGSDGACFERAAGFARKLAPKLLESGLPAASFLNLNLPPRSTDRLRWTRQGKPLGPGQVEVGEDPRGKPYYWIANRPDEIDPPPDTDRGALAAGCISLCLLSLDRSYRDPWTPPDMSGAGFQLECDS